MEYATVTLNPCIDKAMWVNGAFHEDELNRVPESAVYAGGKGINVTRVLKKLGQKTTAFGYIGGGFVADYYTALLAEEGISTEQFIKTKADTRMCVKVHDDEDRYTEFNEKGGPIDAVEYAKMLTGIRAYCREHRGDATLFLCGSAPEGSKNATYAEIGDICRRYKERVILDAADKLLMYGITLPPYLVHTNLEELCTYNKVYAKYFRGKENLDKVLKLAKETAITEVFRTRVICTLGADGAIYTDGETSYYVEAPLVDCNGVEGAGDTFLAAYVHELDRTGGNIPDALRFAASAAAAKVEKTGTEIPEELEMWSRCDTIQVTAL